VRIQPVTSGRNTGSCTAPCNRSGSSGSMHDVPETAISEGRTSSSARRIGTAAVQLARYFDATSRLYAHKEPRAREITRRGPRIDYTQQDFTKNARCTTSSRRGGSTRSSDRATHWSGRHLPSDDGSRTSFWRFGRRERKTRGWFQIPPRQPSKTSSPKGSGGGRSSAGDRSPLSLEDVVEATGTSRQSRRRNVV